MRHIDRLIQEDPRLREIDYQRLVLKAKEDPRAHWDELVHASAPLVFTLAHRLAAHLPEGSAAAEEITRQVFAAIADDDFAVIRNFVGYGKWTSLLLRLTQQSPLLREGRRRREWPELAEQGRPAVTLDDPDAPIAELEDRLEQLCDEEGDRLLEALWKAIHTLHRRDRLLLGMRYEQGLFLKELDVLFHLGTPARVAALLEKVRHSLQPFHSVVEAWEVPPEQEESLMRRTLGVVFRERSLATHPKQPAAPAVPSH